jgi:hypothetical protein
MLGNQRRANRIYPELRKHDLRIYLSKRLLRRMPVGREQPCCTYQQVNWFLSETSCSVYDATLIEKIKAVTTAGQSHEFAEVGILFQART